MFFVDGNLNKSVNSLASQINLIYFFTTKWSHMASRFTFYSTLKLKCHKN